jgi:hypothetical protein
MRAHELQQAVVERERRRVSSAICAQRRPQHRAIVGRIATAITALVDALAEERDFREALVESGVAFTSELRAMPLPGAGLYNDPRGEVRCWRSGCGTHATPG